MIKTAIDFASHLPLEWVLQAAHHKNVRVYWDIEQEVWARAVEVTGKEVDGWFIPDEGQIITYKIKLQNNEGGCNNV